MRSRHSNMYTGALTQALLSLTACSFMRSYSMLKGKIITCQHAVNCTCIMYETSRINVCMRNSPVRKGWEQYPLNRKSNHQAVEHTAETKLTVMSSVSFVAQTLQLLRAQFLPVPQLLNTDPSRVLLSKLWIKALIKCCIWYSKFFVQSNHYLCFNIVFQSESQHSSQVTRRLPFI